jgi:hypothetical protein
MFGPNSRYDQYQNTASLAMSDVLDDIYNAFDPFRPLPAGDPAYVDCQDVRGDNNILVDLGRGLKRSKQLTYQLYSGHRGAGKSTELLRLKADLESYGFLLSTSPQMNKTPTAKTLSILIFCWLAPDICWKNCGLSIPRL